MTTGLATCIFLIIAVWDVCRRHINDNRAAREFRADQATRLLQELQETSAEFRDLKVYLQDRQKVSEQALVNFISQAQELVQKLDDKRREAEKRAVRGQM